MSTDVHAPASRGRRLPPKDAAPKGRHEEGTVLVTGGAGFIGSHLVDALLARGYRVRVVDDFSTGHWENLADAEATGRVEVWEGSVEDPALLRVAMKGVRWVFHLAARIFVAESVDDPVAYHRTNVLGTVQVLQAAREAGVERVVLASSAAVYGVPERLPLGEDAPLRPLSPYAAEKIANEMDARVFTHLGLPVVALRLFNVYGPRQRPDNPYAAVIVAFLSRWLQGRAPVVYGDGSQTRDFVYVGDVVQAFLRAAQAPQAPGGVFNVCRGRAVSLLDLLAAMRPLFPDHVPEPEFAPPRPGDIPHSIGDPTRAREVLGFQAQTSLEQGLRETLTWMQRHLPLSRER